MFEKPEVEIKNAVWHLKVLKGKISIEHRPTGSKLQNLTTEDLKNLSALIGSSNIAVIEESKC